MSASISPVQEVLARVVAARATAGAASELAVVQVQVHPRETTPLHVHDEDEVVRTLDGSVVLHLPGKQLTLPAGDAHVIPLGVPHAVAGGEVGARYLTMSHVRSVEDYQRFVFDKLSKLPNIAPYRSTLIMRVVKHTTVLPV